MTFYKDFVHRAMDYLRKNGIKTPIFFGGPYPTGDYKEVLKDKNIDICMLGEGDYINRFGWKDDRQQQ